MLQFKSRFKRVFRALASKRSFKIWLRDWEGLGDLSLTATALQAMRTSQKLIPLQINVRKKRVLVLAPHPDDESIGVGGTLLLHKKVSSKIHIVFLTSGKADSAATRRKEAKKVSARLSASCTFFEYLPSNIPICNESSQRLKKEIEIFQPEILMIPFFLDDNDDHRRVTHLLLNTYSHIKTKQSLEVWAYQVYSSIPTNVLVDITSVSNKKSQLIRIHKSEVAKRDWSHFSLGLNAYMSRFLQTKKKAHFVETFFVVSLKEYINFARKYFKKPKDCYYTDKYKELSDE